MKRLKQINQLLQKIEAAFGTTALLVIFFLITINIIKRYFLHNAWGWAGELNGFLYAWVAFISAAYSMANDHHVNITLLEKKFGKKVSSVVRIFTDLLAVVGFGLLAFPTCRALQSMTKTAALRWPKAPVYSVLLIAYALYIIHSLIQIANRVYFLKTGADLLAEDNVPDPGLE